MVTHDENAATAKCRPRCWFSYYGFPGSSSPTCRRCGRKNPNYRPVDDVYARADKALGHVE